MATMAEAITEKTRLMRAYPGLTGRVTTLSSAFGVEVHDARRGERKTTGQRSVIDGVTPGSSPGHFVGWSGPAEPAAWMAVYP